MLYNFILLQAGAETGYNSLMVNLVFISGILLVFYFFMIRPQQKKQKDQLSFRNSIKKGDNVVTISGLHGKIYAMDDETITLEVDKSVKLTFDRSAISMEASKRIMEKDKV